MTPDLVAYYGQGHAVSQGFWVLILLIAIRDAIRKGIALRKSGTKRHIIRFVCLFIFNTAGILPIIYILFFANKSEKNAEIAIKNAAERVEKEAKEDIKKTVAKVEQLIKAAPKTAVKKAPAKKPAAKKAPTKKSK